VYLLDGDTLFSMLAPQHLLLTYDENLPEAIIVDVAYGFYATPVNRRDYDFSAPATDGTENRGGALAFLQFLKTELIPQVERRVRANPARRVLVGQSRSVKWRCGAPMRSRTSFGTGLPAIPRSFPEGILAQSAGSCSQPSRPPCRACQRNA
jgi:enterochelin esterase-like enzyme